MFMRPGNFLPGEPRSTLEGQLCLRIHLAGNPFSAIEKVTMVPDRQSRQRPGSSELDYQILA